MISVLKYRAHGLAAALGLVALSLATGCGGGHDALEKELGELRTEVSRLRAQSAQLSERVDQMDARARAVGTTAPVGAALPAPAPVVSARDGDRPVLDVVRLTPPSEGDGDADNDPSRPLVRVVGDAKQTLNNGTIAQRAARKGLTSVKKADADGRPTVKQ